MSANLKGFNAAEHEDVQDFTPIPAGEYLAVIVESEMKQNKAGTGNYLQLTFEVIEGEHKGRNLWARLNLINPNAVAVKIAQQELATICRAVGVLTPQDSAQLHDLPMRIKVKLTKRADGEPTNEIAGYKSRMTGSDAANGVVAGSIAPNNNGNGGAVATPANKPAWLK